MAKDKELKIRCDEEFIEMIDHYVSRYNEKYGHIKKRNRSRIVEEAIWQYVWTNRNNIPVIEDGR